MLIINQWATDAIGYITDDIEVKDEIENNKSVECLYINGNCFAKLEDVNLMDRLNQRIHAFVDKCKRTTDTFDIGAEINMIKENKTTEPIHNN